MLKNLLVRLGLARAPAPVRSYFMASRFGLVPAAAYVGWRYRRELMDVAKKVNARIRARRSVNVSEPQAV